LGVLEVIVGILNPGSRILGLIKANWRRGYPY